MTRDRIASRSGMTLVEVMVALLVGLLVLSTAMTFFGQQGAAFNRGTVAMNALQNGRYAVNTMEKDIRTAGVGLAPRQPPLVYAGPDVLAFNADYATGDPADTDAVYVDENAPADQLQAVRREGRFMVPMTVFGYPDSTYYRGDTNSPAETLTFFFQPDATTARTDDFALYRQVNAATPAVVARNLLPTDGEAFFTYQVVRVPEDGPTQMMTVPGPLAHRAPLHGSPADTGTLARIDSVRAVRVQFTVTNGETGAREQLRTVDRTVRLPNAGMATRNVCGDPPLGTGLGARLVGLPGGQPAVQLAWNASADEAGGEGDVLRYILWKAVDGAPFADPWVSIPAGLSTYSYLDEAVVPGQSVQYAVVVQDCTPSRSPLAPSPIVVIP